MSHTEEQEKLVNQILNGPRHEYYKILAIERTASDSEIKKSYRKLALRMHPDKNPHPKAAEAFKVVNKAFEVLSDDDKRRIYDQTGHDPDDRRASASAGFSSGASRQQHPFAQAGFANHPFAQAGFGNGFAFGGNDDIFDFLFQSGAFGGPGVRASTFSFGPGGGVRFRGPGQHPFAQFMNEERQQQQQEAQEMEEDRASLMQMMLPILLILLVPLLEQILGARR